LQIAVCPTPIVNHKSWRQLISANGPVMLSEALQRNAKDEARLSNIFGFVLVLQVTEMIRDSSLRSE
jgi:hypothetical protein